MRACLTLVIASTFSLTVCTKNSNSEMIQYVKTEVFYTQSIIPNFNK